MDVQTTITKPIPSSRQKTTEVVPFRSTLARHHLELVRKTTHTLLINLGFLCNQTCRHCHLEAGPGRKENMDSDTLNAVVAYAQRNHFETMDITGGAPELNPLLPDLIQKISPQTPRIMLRSNLSALKKNMSRLIDTLKSHKAEFANGVRLVYPMHEEAMRFVNLVGNKLFSLGFSWVLGQSIKDTLCGTKAMWRKDYEVIAKHRSYFGEIDPFGDFDLLLGAAKSNLKIVDIPIRYRSRTYGSTNISRWRHGALLFQMLFTAARKIKFI